MNVLFIFIYIYALFIEITLFDYFREVFKILKFYVKYKQMGHYNFPLILQLLHSPHT